MKLQPGQDGIAIYHIVLAHEDFDRTAFNLLKLIQKAQREYPDQKRSLYLDIEDQRNAAGDFDEDMLELQSKFATEFLLPFLSRIVMPLVTYQNPQPQKNDIPNALDVLSIDKPKQEPPDQPPSGTEPNPRF